MPTSAPRMTAEQAKDFARRWLEAWNSRQIDKIMVFYAQDAVTLSPVVSDLLGLDTGLVQGHDALREFYSKGIERIPYLHFEAISVFLGVSSVVVYYVNHKGTRTCECLELDAAGKIVRDSAHYLV